MHPAENMPRDSTAALESILVIGLGNPLLGDDGVGWRVADEVRACMPADKETSRSIQIEYLAVGGLGLMEQMVGCQHVVLIDAITSGLAPIGAVRKFELDDLPPAAVGHTASSHDTSLANALEMGREMGFDLPEQVWVVAVEITPTFVFSEQLSLPIEAAIPEAARFTLETIEKMKEVSR